MNPGPPSPWRRCVPWLLTGLHAALFVVSTVIVFIEDARSPALQAVFYGLWTVMLASSLWQSWRDWRAGLLSMPLTQLYQHIRRGGGKRTSLLEFSAMLIGIVAMTILTTG